jgi:dienelactone hydrolase
LSWLFISHYSAQFHEIPSCRNESKLSLEEIMKGDDFVGYQPKAPFYLPDGNVSFVWQSPKDSLEFTYIWDAKKNILRKASEIELNYLPQEQPTWHPSNRMCVYTLNNKVYSWTVNQSQPTLIYKSLLPVWGVYTVNNTDIIYLYREDVITKIDTKKMYIEDVLIFKESPAKEKVSESSDFLEKQHNTLFNFDQERGSTTKSSPTNSPVVVKNGKSINHISVSPDEKYIVFEMVEYAKTEPTHYMDYVDKTGYALSKSARPKVGRKEHKYALHAFSIEAQKELHFDHETLVELNRMPDYYKEYGRTLYMHKGVCFHPVKFNTSSRQSMVEIKSLDNKHRWLAKLDFEKEQLIVVDHEYDDAWIGGPCIHGWNEASGTMNWIPNSQLFYFVSERNGFSHVYIYDAVANKTTDLTQGEFEIHDVSHSPDGQMFYIVANKTHPGNRNVYQINLKTKQWTTILEQDGAYEVAFSPDYKNMAYRFSNSNTPWEIYVSPNKADAQAIQITQSSSDKFKNYSFTKPEVISYKAQDNTNVYARIFRPKNEVKNGAGVIFIHGAGYLQNAHNYWSHYVREYMFHHFLVDNGYTVLDVDYRGSEGYGRDFRTGIYRHMGGKDLSDIVDGAKFLVDKEGVDEFRIGVYGGSYGGFLTLMALFNTDVFKCGAALRSVTDWAHYNHEYTSNILNTPEEDEVAYQRSSPIYFAENLKSRLLMLHGVLDDNVQYQDIIRLTQRLIELQKDNWELASYPIEKHSFKVTSSWIDEYKRIYKLFEEELNAKK